MEGGDLGEAQHHLSGCRGMMWICCWNRGGRGEDNKWGADVAPETGGREMEGSHILRLYQRVDVMLQAYCPGPNQQINPW